MPELRVDQSVPNRDLVRLLRTPPASVTCLPESLLWQAYLELKRRGESGMEAHFLQGLRGLHRRRTLGTSELPMVDTEPDEHRLAEDPYLAELWRSYKRCLCANRTGPAAQILREFEQQIQAH